MVDVPLVGVLVAIVARHGLIARGQAPPLVAHHHQPGESSSYANGRLGSLLCHDVGLCLLTSVGPRLHHRR
jgi:hypothetical protein